MRLAPAGAAPHACPRSAILHRSMGKPLPRIGRIGHRTALGKALRIYATARRCSPPCEKKRASKLAPAPRAGIPWQELAALRELIQCCEAHQPRDVDAALAGTTVQTVAGRFRSGR